MLFTPQAVHEARDHTLQRLDRGELTPAQVLQELLQRDPDDHIAMVGMARLRRDAGDLAGAEEYLWRAIETHPCGSVHYLQLAHILFQAPESSALAAGLSELGLSNFAYNLEAASIGLDAENTGVSIEAVPESFKTLSAAAQCTVMAKASRKKRAGEPAAVGECLRPYRLLQQIQENGDLDALTVNRIIAEGQRMVPVLIGAMRGWARNLLAVESDTLVENSLALLGEIGPPAMIEHLLEFVDLEHEGAGGASRWAMGRIIERQPKDSAAWLGSIIADLDLASRLAVADQIMHHAVLDPAGSLLERLPEGLDSMEKADRDRLFPPILISMAMGRGVAGLKMAGTALLSYGSLLSPITRNHCEKLLRAVRHESVSPIPIEPSPFDIYDICGGNAVWDEEMEPEPVARKVVPGRNDPCWCNSGKKYKKCHLESDEGGVRDVPREVPDPETPVWQKDQFSNLRRRLGDFLGEVLPAHEMKRAIREFFGEDGLEEELDKLPLVDWILHDRFSSSLRGTVMGEFLERRGSGLTKPEQQMLDAWSRSFVVLYEVQQIEEGKGLLLEDLIFGEKIFVHDVNMSERLLRWDVIFARVVPGERGTEVTGAGLLVPRNMLSELREWMDHDRRVKGAEWPRYLKNNWYRIRQRSLEIAITNRESLRLANTDGDELLISKAVYRVTDQEALIKALLITALKDSGTFRSEPGEKTGAPHFVWLNHQQTVLGNIKTGDGQLALQCNSRERLERGKQLLESIAGTLLRHLRDEFTTQKELMRQAANAQPTPMPESGIPKEEHDAILGQFIEQHYLKWPDTNLPGLNGKTAREAVKNAEGRARVVELLKDIENGEERKRRSGSPSFDMGRVRKELGLE